MTGCFLTENTTHSCKPAKFRETGGRLSKCPCHRSCQCGTARTVDIPAQSQHCEHGSAFLPNKKFIDVLRRERRFHGRTPPRTAAGKGSAAWRVRCGRGFCVFQVKPIFLSAGQGHCRHSPPTESVPPISSLDAASARYPR